jgi:magnesium-protoporphyrin IX monomethyl ester (oxidative) cyclase
MTERVDVTLVSMPFAELQRPSIALGLLRAALSGTRISSEVVYANFRFAEAIGLVAYQAMQSTPTDHLLGEWCFASCLFGDSPARDEEYLNLVLEVRCHGFPASLEERKHLMQWVRSRAHAYIDALAASIVERQPRIVGCSSVFQQHCASLALLRRVHELSPDTITLMGGANCEGEMGVETLRAFPWVDCVVSGEADALFRDLCHLFLEHGRAVETQDLPYGAMSQATLATSVARPPRPVLHDLDALPTPDYDDYFKTVKSSPLAPFIRPGLLAESSRGCWWGEKAHCTFCGLNGQGMRFRSKSPERMIAEMSELAERYGTRSIQFVDNILDMSYLRTLLPTLAASRERYLLFYETKANLKKEHVRLLAEAGVLWIQPGIESLDDNVLHLIAKGNSTAINLQLLKWARQYGIDAAWNMLVGIPGEQDKWYADMAKWLPLIFHLQPPTGVNRVRYDRFSPYHSHPQIYGLSLTPSRAYEYVYPLPVESLMRLAYSFEDTAQREHVHRAIHEARGQRELQSVVTDWNAAWNSPGRPVLQARHGGRRVEFLDTRPCAPRKVWTAGGLHSDIYRLCDSAQSFSTLLEVLGALRDKEVSAKDVEEAVEDLCEAKVLLRVRAKLLSLGISENDDRACVPTRETASPEGAV